MIERVIYTITAEDVRKVAKEEHIPVTKKDMPFIEDKVGDYFREKWQEAIVYALNELTRTK
jgi:hypothetical protein